MKNKKENKKYIIAVDIGGTTSKFAIFDENKILDEWSIATDVSNNGKNVVKDICKSIKLYAENNSIEVNNICGVGITVPGYTKDDTYALKAVNLGWNKPINIKKQIEKYLYKSIIVKIGNDGDVAAFGEYTNTVKDLKKNKMKTFIMITLGTGVGIGLIIDGKIYEGHNKKQMELSHMKVDWSEDAIKCQCKNVGCLETVSSARGVKRILQRLLKSDEYANLKSIYRLYDEKTLNNDMKVNSKDICANAKKKDPLALLAVKTSMWYLGYAIGVMILALDPSCFVIGGGLSNAGSFIIPFIKKGIKDTMTMNESSVDIRISKLKNEAGKYGAFYLVKNELNKNDK